MGEKRRTDFKKRINRSSSRRNWEKVQDAFNKAHADYNTTFIMLENTHAKKHCGTALHSLTFLCILPCSSLCLDLL